MSSFRGDLDAPVSFAEVCAQCWRAPAHPNHDPGGHGFVAAGGEESTLEKAAIAAPKPRHGSAISAEKEAEVIAAFARGLSASQVRKLCGVSQGTAIKYRPAAVPDCPCGEPGGHRGWCAVRTEKSPRRQAVLAKLRGLEVEPEGSPYELVTLNLKPRSVSKLIATAGIDRDTDPALWAAAVVMLSAPDAKLPFAETEVIRKRLRDSVIWVLSEGKTHALRVEWVSGDHSNVAFTLDAMVGAGELQRSRDGKYRRTAQR